MTFHNKILNAKLFRDKLIKVNRQVGDGNLYINSISSHTRFNTRTDLLEALANANTCVLTSVNVLNEGINVPALDFVSIVEPRSSTTQITQIIGRVMRNSKGKETGYVIVPVIADKKKGLTFGNFEKVRFVLETLAELDGVEAQLVGIARRRGGTILKKLINEYVKFIKDGEEVVDYKWINKQITPLIYSNFGNIVNRLEEACTQYGRVPYWSEETVLIRSVRSHIEYDCKDKPKLLSRLQKVLLQI